MPKKETGKSTKKSTTKNTASKKVSTTKKTTSKKVDTKSTKVEVKNKPAKVVETKKVVEKETVKPIIEEKKTERINEKNKESIFDKVMNNTPFAVSLCVIVILVAMLIFALCIKKVPKTSKGDDIVAKLNGKSITANELYDALRESNGTDTLINLVDTYIANKEVKITDADKDYAKEVVNYYKDYADYYGTDLNTFIANYLGIPGVTNEEEFFDYVLEDYKKTLAIKKFIGDNAKEEDLKEYYKNNYSDKLTAKHILIEVDKDAEDAEAAEQEALEKAKKLIEELNNTDKDNLVEKFEELAKNNSADTATYANGGLIEDFTKSSVEEAFFNAANELEDGKYTAEPVKTSYGYHIILRVSSKSVEKYEDVKDEVKDKYAESLLNNDNTLRVTKWDELRKQYKLSIEDDFIKKAYNKTINSVKNQKTEEND